MHHFSDKPKPKVKAGCVASHRNVTRCKNDEERRAGSQDRTRASIAARTLLSHLAEKEQGRAPSVHLITLLRVHLLPPVRSSTRLNRARAHLRCPSYSARLITSSPTLGTWEYGVRWATILGSGSHPQKTAREAPSYCTCLIWNLGLLRHIVH